MGSVEFVSDTFGACRKFRILAVSDACCRENPGLIADTGISGVRVAQELYALVRLYGKPACIVSDRRRSENANDYYIEAFFPIQGLQRRHNT